MENAIIYLSVNLIHLGSINFRIRVIVNAPRVRCSERPRDDAPAQQGDPVSPRCQQ